ncbi:DUF4817 domain-containing protein [Trichonephila clavipes]|nr:DUF4817 domain-containing protein [Trichonephila clavipes]
MDGFRATGNVSKERKGAPKTVRTTWKCGTRSCANSNRHGTMVQQFLLLALHEKDLDEEWLQLDGVTAHTFRVSIGILRAALPKLLISLLGDINCPAYSPDLSPLDYLLWSYLKSLVYKDLS